MLADPCLGVTPPSPSKVCLDRNGNSIEFKNSNLLAVVEYEAASVYTGQLTIHNGPIRGSFLVSSVSNLISVAKQGK